MRKRSRILCKHRILPTQHVTHLLLLLCPILLHLIYLHSLRQRQNMNIKMRATPVAKSSGEVERHIRFQGRYHIKGEIRVHYANAGRWETRGNNAFIKKRPACSTPPPPPPPRMSNNLISRINHFTMQ